METHNSFNELAVSKASQSPQGYSTVSTMSAFTENTDNQDMCIKWLEDYAPIRPEEALEMIKQQLTACEVLKKTGRITPEKEKEYQDYETELKAQRQEIHSAMEQKARRKPRRPASLLVERFRSGHVTPPEQRKKVDTVGTEETPVIPQDD